MGHGRTAAETIGVVVLAVVRSVALWILWPAAVVIWLVRTPYGRLRRRHVGLRSIAGWLDNNLVAMLEATVLRPFFAERATHFKPWSAAATITDSPSPLDAW